MSAQLSRLHELSDLDLSSVAVSYSTSRWVITFGVQQFGPGRRFTERISQMGAGLNVGVFTTSLLLSHTHLSFGGNYSSKSSIALGGSLSARFKGFNIAGAIRNINNPRLSPGLPSQPLTTLLIAEIADSSTVTTWLSLRAQEKQRSRLGIGQRLRIEQILSLYWGLALDPTEPGFGFDLKHGRITIGYAGSFHTHLGYTHGVSIQL